MKTAISISDELFSYVERTAKQLGIARSQLFAKAVEEFIENHNLHNVTSRIDSVLADESHSLDPHLELMQATTIRREDPDESW